MRKTKNKKMKLFLLSCLTILFISMKSESVFAQDANVTLPTFNVTMNDVKIENEKRKYPFIVYKNITYFPMTYTDSRFFGLQTKWNSKTGLEVFYTGELGSYKNFKPNYQNSKNAKYLKASIPTFNVKVNGKLINNSKEPYPLLIFRDVTYFPLTWRFAVNEFHWGYHFSHKKGLIIDTVKGYGELAVTPEKVRAIKLGEMTLDDVEKLFGTRMVNIGIPDWYEPWGGSNSVVADSKNVIWGKTFPWSPVKYPQVTEENYYKLESGMSYEEVSAILGGPGSITFESLYGKEYEWEGPENTSISLVFRKDRNGFSLTFDVGTYGRTSYRKHVSYDSYPTKYPEATEQNFNKLAEGMSYEEASAILGGSGLVIYDSKYQKMYLWHGTENTAITLVFIKDHNGLSLSFESVIGGSYVSEFMDLNKMDRY